MTRAVLIQCPAWLTYAPPFGMASVATFLHAKGYSVKCFDINTMLYRSIESPETSQQNTLLNKEAWDFRVIDHFWRDIEKLKVTVRENTEFIESIIQQIVDFEPEVITFSVYYTSEYYSQLFSNELRKRIPKALIIWGGPFCFPNYDGIQALQKYESIDAVYTSIISQPVHSFIQDWLSQVLNKQYPGMAYRFKGKNYDYSADAVFDDINDMPFTNYSLLDQSLYGKMTTLPMITARGCINRCAFCNESSHWAKYSYRKAARIVEEIEYQMRKYPQVCHLWFTDLLVNGDLKNLEDLCDLIITKKIVIGWDAQFTIRKNIKPELIAKMKQAGCQGLHIGLESGSTRVLKLMRKGYNVADALKVLGMIYRAGIKVHINIIVGFPGESKLNIVQTACTLINLFKFKITPPPAAVCAIHKDSLLADHPEIFNIVNADNGEWYVSKGPRNTAKIRYKRQAFIKMVVDVLSSAGFYGKLKAVLLILLYLLLPEK